MAFYTSSMEIAVHFFLNYMSQEEEYLDFRDV